MPKYRVLSEEVLVEWNDKLNSLVVQLINNPTEEHLAYLLMEVFEYVQMYAYYTKRVESGIVENVVVSYKELKDNFELEDERAYINLFKNTADGLRHISYKKKLVKSLVNLIISRRDISKKFILSALKEDSLVYKLFLTSKIERVVEEIYNHDNVKKKIECSCNNLFECYTIGEILEFLTKKGYSISICREVVCECLSKYYLVKE